MKTVFKKGSKVKVVGCGANASDFRIGDISIVGVYSLENWETTTFEVMGDYKEITFEHNPRIYGAYPIGLNGRLLGYVYNTGLEEV